MKTNNINQSKLKIQNKSRTQNNSFENYISDMKNVKRMKNLYVLSVNNRLPEDSIRVPERISSPDS
jgi:hypothetical protein